MARLISRNCDGNGTKALVELSGLCQKQGVALARVVLVVDPGLDEVLPVRSQQKISGDSHACIAEVADQCVARHGNQYCSLLSGSASCDSGIICHPSTELIPSHQDPSGRNS
ncbi:hypothetical protein KIN20_020671 [Parelaphostrongylus tenuis]|uniref:Uncharacterized protein n=1 Tax=Parelaphostrongylus tenuis TaxID=148309 RepID=A0AAD5MMS5_PARTN|nr:hypothetical protein KIN20_020671 [Parelaphostrongylus tenuis]